VQVILLARLLTERIRSGELTRFDAEFADAWRLAAGVLHSPELQIALRRYRHAAISWPGTSSAAPA
jgi:hypothetical protein